MRLVNYYNHIIECTICEISMKTYQNKKQYRHYTEYQDNNIQIININIIFSLSFFFFNFFFYKPGVIMEESNIGKRKKLKLKGRRKYTCHAWLTCHYMIPIFSFLSFFFCSPFGSLFAVMNFWPNHHRGFARKPEILTAVDHILSSFCALIRGFALAMASLPTAL